MITPIGFLIYWQLRSKVVFISFLNDTDNLVFVRENGKVELQNNQGKRLGQKKFRNLRSIIGKQSDGGLFACSTNKQELLILEINDKINHCIIPTEYYPDKATFSVTDKNLVASSSELFDRIDIFDIARKKQFLKIRSPYPVKDYLIWGHTLWVLCGKKGQNIYTIDMNDSDHVNEVTLTDGIQQNYDSIIGCKFLHHENRLALYSKNCIYLVDDNGVENTIMDCDDNEIVSIIGKTNTEIYVLCKYIDYIRNTSGIKIEKYRVLVWNMNLGELIFQNEIDENVIRYCDPIFSPKHKSFIYVDQIWIAIFNMVSSEYQRLPSSIDKLYHKWPPLCLNKSEDQLAYYAVIKTVDSRDEVRVIDLKWLKCSSSPVFPPPQNEEQNTQTEQY